MIKKIYYFIIGLCGLLSIAQATDDTDNAHQESKRHRSEFKSPSLSMDRDKKNEDIFPFMYRKFLCVRSHYGISRYTG